MRIFLCAALLFVAPAHAAGELYLDVGIGKMWGLYRAESSDPGSAKEVPPPHATVEVGYSFGDTTVFAAHISSLADGGDRGVELVGVKHRFSVKFQ